MTVDAQRRLERALGSRYRILRVLGVGGMATVFLAEDLRHERKVAVKVLRPECAASVGSARFLKEIRLAGQLAHPHIVPVLDSGDVEGFLYYVMPYAAGESLAARLAREGVLPVPDAVSIVRDVLDGLAYAHRRGVVHRDIKPANILLQHGHAMVLDFGVAKAVRDASLLEPQDLTAAGMAIGTPAYMAPEQAAADPGVDHRADLYAVGVLAYELLTGRPPFAADPPHVILKRQMEDVPTPLAQRRSDVPAPLAALVMRCLEKQPTDRWQSAAEILPILGAMAGAGAPPIPAQVRSAALDAPTWSAAPDPLKASRRGRARRGMAAAATTAALLLGGALGWAGIRTGEVGTQPRAVVSVYENLSGDPALDPIGAMLQDWLTDGLLQSGLLEVVPTITARQASDFVEKGLERGGLRDPIAALAEETGADIVVSGTVHMVGSELRVRTSVVRIAADGTIEQLAALDPVRGPASEATALFDELRGRLLGALAAALDRRLLAQIGGHHRAPTFEAYRVFGQALDLYAARSYREASALFLEAYELDPTYPVPLVYASLSLRNHDDWARSDSVVRLMEARREELSEYQRFWIDYSRAVLSGDLDRARIMVRRAAALAPGSKAAYNWALIALRMGRPAEAREALASLDPDRGTMRGDPRYWMRQIEASHHLGDHEREVEQVEALAARFPEERSIFYYRVKAYSALGWSESLKAAFAAQAATRIPPDVMAVRYRNAAVDLWVHGHREAAREIAELGIAWIDTRTTAEERPSGFTAGTDLHARQQLAYQKGRLLEVLGDERGALAIYEELYAQLPDAWFLRAHMGVIHATLGHISDAMQIDRWLQTLERPYQQGDVTAWRAGIASALGDLDRGTELLQRARREGVYWSDLHAVFHLHDAMDEHRPFLRAMSPQD